MFSHAIVSRAIVLPDVDVQAIPSPGFQGLSLGPKHIVFIVLPWVGVGATGGHPLEGLVIRVTMSVESILILILRQAMFSHAIVSRAIVLPDVDVQAIHSHRRDKGN